MPLSVHGHAEERTIDAPPLTAGTRRVPTVDREPSVAVGMESMMK
jgi:hypothetical protein